MSPLDSAPASAQKGVQHNDQTPSKVCIMKHDGDNHSSDDGLSVKQTQDLIGLGLDFLSTSSNERFLVVLGCLTGATYLLLGRLGLLLIGMVIGVTVHASWESSSPGHPLELRNSSRRELSLKITHKLLDGQGRKSFNADRKFNNNDKEKLINCELATDIDGSIVGPATAIALKSLIDAVVKDYVNYWYEPILPSESTFPLSCRRTLTGFVASISSHLQRKRTADTFLGFLTNSSSIIIVFLNELAAAFEDADPSLTPEETVLHYLESYPESSLSSILANEQQRKKLNMISDDILSNFLDPRVYNCFPLKNLLREVFARVVFESALSSLSRPEFINSWIVYLFSEGESEIMNAIDAGVEGARTQEAAVNGSSEIVDKPASISADGAPPRPNSPPQLVDDSSAKIDRATEEAIVEAKRLSDMIAAQGLQNSTEQTPVSRPDRHLSSKDPIDTTPKSEARKKVTESTHDNYPGLQSKPTISSYDLLPNLLERPSHDRSSISTSSAPLANSLLALSPSDNNSMSSNFVLHHACITVDDSSGPGENGQLRSKPISNYLLQVEPLSTRCTGWMVFRKYSDFEAIHETLCTISRLNDIRSFTDVHPVLPQWKGQTNRALTLGLEQYLRDALRHEPLAESERMRRFLEKDDGLGPKQAGASTKSGLFFPSPVALENVGKGVLGVLAKAPRGVSGGSKAVLDGVTGVFGGGVTRRSSPTSSTTGPSNKDSGSSPKEDEMIYGDSGAAKESKVSENLFHQNNDPKDDTPLHQYFEQNNSISKQSPQKSCQKMTSDANTLVETLKSEAYVSDEPIAEIPSNSANLYVNNDRLSASQDGEYKDTHPDAKEAVESTRKDAPGDRGSLITQDETRIAVELIFAVINELYSLSSAWAIRRTLLNAAKSYILRPGNPSLETIRSLLQDSMIDNHTSDESIGLYLKKLRENALPTEEELASWPGATSGAEKDRLREIARKAFTQKGLPQAITGVMGAAASREALGKVFDCLQVELISRGLVFAVLCQASSAILL